jgi:hypothetical protein
MCSSLFKELGSTLEMKSVVPFNVNSERNFLLEGWYLDLTGGMG